MTVIKREICKCEECGTENVVEYPLFENWQEYYDIRIRYHDQMVNYSNNSWTYPAPCKKCSKEYERPVAGIYKRTFGCKACTPGPLMSSQPVKEKVAEGPKDLVEDIVHGVVQDIEQVPLDDDDTYPESRFDDPENITIALDPEPEPAPEPEPEPENDFHFSLDTVNEPETQVIKEPIKVKKHMVSAEKQEALARWYVLLIDKSFSMTISDQNGGTRGDRWGSAEQMVTDLLDTIFEFAIDKKLPTYLFGSNAESIGELTNKMEVLQLFHDHTPEGSTNLSDTLDLALEDTFEKTKDKLKEFPGMTVIVITDGQPDSEANVKNVLLKFADPVNDYIDKNEDLAISFIQIGDDQGAKAFLDEMDKGFEFNGEVVKICDTKTIEEVNILGVYRILHDAIFD
ncbi:MAG: hypothetical protein AB8G05_09230 [Oligoflexales bacterium]